MVEERSPPLPLPSGWILKESRSQPGCFFYYNIDTGVSSWQAPQVEKETITETLIEAVQKETSTKTTKSVEPKDKETSVPSKKRSAPETTATTTSQAPNKKRSKTSAAPKQVRVLHILKKHKDSKRPASWRSHNKPIKITKQQAIEELQSLLEILQEEQHDTASLTATFKELAKSESDCSSAKRHGDLGFFGRKKMRPEFEQASFALEIGELSGIVETASGVHIILRIE